MLISILIVLLILAIIVIAFLLRRVSTFKVEKRTTQDNMKNICHEFMTSLSTLQLTMNGLKDGVELLQKNNKDSEQFLSLLDILNDVGQNISKNVDKLIKQVKH